MPSEFLLKNSAKEFKAATFSLQQCRCAVSLLPKRVAASPISTSGNVTHAEKYQKNTLVPKEPGAQGARFHTIIRIHIFHKTVVCQH